jgi:hypothetical protein
MGGYLCPICGKEAGLKEYKLGYLPCPGGCGNNVHTPCTDRGELAPCGHEIVGQINIEHWQNFGTVDLDKVD